MIFDISFMIACWTIPEKISLLQIFSTIQPNALGLQRGNKQLPKPMVIQFNDEYMDQ